MRLNIIVLTIILFPGVLFAQTNRLEKLNFLLGEWSGKGSGFVNNNSRIESNFNLVMSGNYIEVKNESFFEPTEDKPDGEHHLDKGFISFDKNRKTIVYRQFNNEGYYNQYVLNHSLSNDTLLVFNTEYIENFVLNGKAKWTIKKISEDKIETQFYVSFGKDYSCFGTNILKRKN